MKKVTFKNIKIEGFGVISGYKVFPLSSDFPQLNVIRGKNGRGKTTLFSALTWALYGKPLKPGSSIETWAHARPSTFSGTMVSVSFYVDGVKCKVTRCKDYNKVIGKLKGANRLILEQDGTETVVKDKRDVQKVIEELLGMSFNLFTNSVLFQQKGVRLLELPGPEKKKILEESFKLTWLTMASDLAKYDKAKLENTLPGKEQALASLIRNEERLKDLLEEMEAMKKDFLKKKKQDMDAINQKLEGLAKDKKLFKDNSDSLDKYLTQIHLLNSNIKGIEAAYLDPEDPSKSLYNSYNRIQEKLKEKDLEVRGLKRNIGEIEAQIKPLDKELIKLTTTRIGEGAKCSYCGYELTEESKHHLQSHLSEDIRQKASVVADLTQKLELANKELSSISAKESETNNAIEAIEKFKREILFYREEISKLQGKALAHDLILNREKELKEQIEAIKDREFKDSSEKVLKQLKELEDEIMEAKIEVQATKSRLAIVNWAIKNPLSNSGIKAYMFSTLLEKLNKRLKYYSSMSGFLVNLYVDEDSGRKNIEATVSKEGFPVDIRDLSGGETQLVNVLIALASGEVLLSGVDVNIRVFDEVSEHLDMSNTELLGSFLKNLSDKFNVFVITHNNQFIVGGSNEIKL